MAGTLDHGSLDWADQEYCQQFNLPRKEAKCVLTVSGTASAAETLVKDVEYDRITRALHPKKDPMVILKFQW